MSELVFALKFSAGAVVCAIGIVLAGALFTEWLKSLGLDPEDWFTDDDD